MASAVAAPLRTRSAAPLAALTCLNALNYLDRFLVAPMLPLIIGSLGLSDRQAGSLQSAFILVYAVVCPWAGWLGDRYPRLRLAAVGVMAWSLATAASGLATTFAGLILARALVGVGEASYTVVTPSLISDLYAPRQRGRALAIFYAAMPFGVAMGYGLGGQIGARHGWRTAFFVAGGPGLLLALILLVLHEPVRGQLDGAPSRAPMSWRQLMMALRRRPSYFVNMAAQTVWSFTMGGLGAWMPTYFVRERHLGIAQAGTMFGALLLGAGFLGTILGGVAGDRLATRFRGAHFTFSAASFLASLPCTVVAISSDRPWVYWSAMGLALFFLFLNQGPLNAALLNILPGQARGRGIGLHTTTIHILGDACSPLLVGIASDMVGLRWPVMVTALLVGVAALLLLAGRRRFVADLDAVAARV